MSLESDQPLIIGSAWLMPSMQDIIYHHVVQAFLLLWLPAASNWMKMQHLHCNISKYAAQQTMVATFEIRRLTHTQTNVKRLYVTFRNCLLTMTRVPLSQLQSTSCCLHSRLCSYSVGASSQHQPKHWHDTHKTERDWQASCWQLAFQ